MMLMNSLTIQSQGKPTRPRGPTWSDDEVHKLFHVWSQPTIFNGFLTVKRKREVFVLLSNELGKLGVNRNWEECRAKIKNLKGDFKKARESDNPTAFKFYNIMDKILSRETKDIPTFSHSSNIIAHPQAGQAVQIEFEIMPTNELSFGGIGGIKGELPIHIIPHHDFSDDIEEIEVIDSGSVSAHLLSHEQELSNKDSNHDEALKLMNGENISSFDLDGQPSSSTGDRSLFSEAYVNTGKRVKSLASDINSKRRKLHSLSEKMAESLERILTQTSNSLIEEMKASEERYMQWEEKKRIEDQKREEEMLKTLVNAMRSKPEEKEKRNPDEEERRRLMEIINASDDPCALTFDLLATKLTNQIADQQKEVEHSLIEWESKMQRQETRHTENLFNMIIRAVKNQNSEDENS